ncbi:hypothetical protein [Luteibacter sp. Lutesp34]|uniref:hypothetical protein n=1 Tax=Luteibacter sp. Lutesp34 TaxID=3243030 RepID=UPI0039B4A1D9
MHPRTLLGAALLLAACCLSSIQADAAVLKGGESLAQGQRLYSDDGRYFATLQSDGNFIVYRHDGQIIWATYTHGRGAVRATMQTDGNFVLYDAHEHAVWSTRTNGPWHMFTVSEHGQAMILTPKDWWQSRTGNDQFAQGSPLIFPYGFNFNPGEIHRTGGPHSLAFQHDGNLVLSRHGQPIWISNTGGAQRAQVNYGLRISQGDEIRFQAKARYRGLPAPGTVLEFKLGYLALFPNGNLVAYRAVPVWTANEYDRRPGFLGDGPFCVGNPNLCGKKLHDKLHHGP